MKTLNFFRKPYLAYVMGFMLLFVSCSKYESNTMSPNKIDASVLKSTHNLIQKDFNNAKNDLYSKESLERKLKIFKKTFQENLDYLNNHNIESLLKKNNISVEMLSAFEYYYANKDKGNIYNDLSNNFNFKSSKDINFLFSTITLYDNLLKVCSSKSTFSEAEIKSMSWGCALAIASTVTITVGAIWVSGGAALLYWIFSKGLATAALIEACGDGWGNIIE